MSRLRPWSGTFYGVPAARDKIEHSDIVYPGPMEVEEAAPDLAKEYSDKKSYNEIFTAISSDSRYSAWPASDRRRLTRYVAEQILDDRRITTQLNFPMGTNVGGDVCNPVCHGQNPWTAEFYGVEPARDEIEHFGNKNSGRYPRGSGKHPDSMQKSIRRDMKKAQDKVLRNTVEWKDRRKGGRRIAAAIGFLTPGTDFGMGTFLSRSYSYKAARESISKREPAFNKLVDTRNKLNLGEITPSQAKKAFESPDVQNMIKKYVSAEIKHGDGSPLAGTYERLSPDKKALTLALADTMLGNVDPTETEKQLFTSLTEDEKIVVTLSALILCQGIEELETLKGENNKQPCAD